jgi:hypothetical protein
MVQAAKKDDEFRGGIFYKTEEDLFTEITRFLKTRRKNRGATKWQIVHVANNRPFVEALQDARQGVDTDYFRTAKEQIRFHMGLRRAAVFPVVKKLLTEGYSIAEISDALTLPYSTTYYYAKKIRQHKRLRHDCTRWHIDEATDCIAPIKLPRDKEAALARKELMRKAKEKRERRMAKRINHHAPTRDRAES